MSSPANPRGTTNGNARGSAADRRARRAWLMVTYASDIPTLVRCYRCGWLLYNPDETVAIGQSFSVFYNTRPLTVDRIIPGCQGGTYRRNGSNKRAPLPPAPPAH